MILVDPMNSVRKPKKKRFYWKTHKTLPSGNAQNASQMEVYSFFNPHFFGLCVRMVYVCEEVV